MTRNSQLWAFGLHSMLSANCFYAHLRVIQLKRIVLTLFMLIALDKGTRYPNQDNYLLGEAGIGALASGKPFEKHEIDRCETGVE